MEGRRKTCQKVKGGRDFRGPEILGRKGTKAQLSRAECRLWNCRGLASGLGPHFLAEDPTAGHVTALNLSCLATK